MATVLLVEDDPAARQGLEMALRRLGHGVRPAVVPELIGAGHQVVGLARSDSSAAAIAAAGAGVLRGDLSDLDTLRAGAVGSGGVIHLAFIHDFTQFEASVQADARAIEAMGAALEGSGKPLVIASGTPALPGRVATERDEHAPGGPAAGRGANAQAAAGMAGRGVRSSVGFLGQVLAVDQPASSALTRDLLGWRPAQPGLIEDLDKGHYFG